MPVTPQRLPWRDHDPSDWQHHRGHTPGVHYHPHGALQSHQWHPDQQAPERQQHVLTDQRWLEPAERGPAAGQTHGGGHARGDGGVQVRLPPEQPLLLVLLLQLLGQPDRRRRHRPVQPPGERVQHPAQQQVQEARPGRQRTAPPGPPSRSLRLVGAAKHYSKGPPEGRLLLHDHHWDDDGGGGAALRQRAPAGKGRVHHHAGPSAGAPPGEQAQEEPFVRHGPRGRHAVRQ